MDPSQRMPPPQITEQSAIPPTAIRYSSSPGNIEIPENSPKVEETKIKVETVDLVSDSVKENPVDNLPKLLAAGLIKIEVEEINSEDASTTKDEKINHSPNTVLIPSEPRELIK